MSKQDVDWESVERDYRAGLLSLREIATDHGSNAATILKRAKKHGWERDLKARIAARAEALVNKQAVNAQVNKDAAVSERQIIEANAERIAQVRGEHRSDIGRARTLTMTLFSELEAQTGNFPALMELGEMLREPNDAGQDKLNDIYRAVITLPERTKTMKALAESLKSLISLEREAYGLEKAVEEPPPSSGIIDPVEGARRVAFILARAGAAIAKQERKNG